ncbi:MAG TPA: HU family DNA-binding protein [Burkholderiaceae bacterium]|nr:HU family DNA-binding protein [Burkholderiaceae bacterium]
MNKANLIEALALKTGHTKVASGEVVDALFEIIGDALANGEKVQLIDFGSFVVSETKARIGRHPRTGESIHIIAAKRLKFTAGAKLKAEVNKK